jgi:ribonuclease HII
MAPRRPRPDLMLERGLGGRVCGIDEVGRGPLAGPVLAAAVVLPDPGHPWGGLPEDVAARIDDSKRLGRALREELAAAIRAALRVFGPCEHHRRSFAPVEEVTAKH